jgi:uncharacterized repeat protein (TIGR01451 family)
MNWQALNPLRLVSATKSGVVALWNHRPRLTKRRVAWGMSLAMLFSGGGYYGYKKFGPGKTPAQATGSQPDQLAQLGGGLQPIPDHDPQGAPPAPDAAPMGLMEDPAGGYNQADASGQGNGGSNFQSGGPPTTGSDGSFVSGPPPAEGAPVEEAPVEGSSGGTDPTYAVNAGTEAGGDASAGSEGNSPQVVTINEAPVRMAAEPSEGDGGEVAPAADSSAPPSGPPPASFAAETNAPPTPPAAGEADSSAAAPDAAPGAPAPEAPSASLIPVPSRPQPAPPEEHVRLPDEAAPNLSPREGFSSPRAGFGGASPIPPPPPGAVASPSPISSGLPPRDFPPAPRGSDSNLPGANVGLPNTSALGGSGAGMGGAGVGGAGVGGAALATAGVPLAISAAPGPKHLEGPQSPSLELEKIAPQEVQVGRPARFEIKVRNVGRAAAQHITVIDQVPQGTRLIDADPPCQRGAEGALRWQLGALGPGQETSIVMQLLPEQEGEIGSVAQVIFHSQAAVRTVSTRPQIAIEHQVVEQALIGDQVRMLLAITNRGTGATSNLVLEATLPEALGHPAGAELEYPIGALRPNETKRIDLALKAQRPGAAPCYFLAREEGQTLAEDRVSLNVLSPQLQVGVNGPKVRYLDRQATYSVAVANPGTAPATNLELVAYLPRGLKYISADNQGQYDPQRHAVLWGLQELPAGVMGASQLIVVPTEPGEQRIRVEGKADLRLEHAFEQPVLVETLSELQFSVVDAADPIEVGSETTYEIRLQNRGSRAASQVRLAVEFPPELAPIGGEGPTNVGVRGQQLIVEPLPSLAPNSQVTYQIRAKGLRKGDPRIRVLVASDESPNPVTKEESTRVYADE